MIKRIIDISKQAYVYMKHKQLILEHNKRIIGSIPIEDLGAVILQHPAIVLTQAVIIACQKNNVILIFCDSQHLPYSAIIPISDAHTLHSKVIQQQINLTLPHKKRLWRQIVQYKIKEQATTLKLLNKDFKTVEYLASRVKAGDKENHEAQAAKKYWRLLMGSDFRRDPDLGEVNALLNYGYAIIRAMVARAIVGSGLHPTLGLHHHNQYNGLCLADDLMEPFRPWVDSIVYQLAKDNKPLKVNTETKVQFLNLLSQPVTFKDKTLPFMVASHHLTASLKEALSNKTGRIFFPKLISRAGKLL